MSDKTLTWLHLSDLHRCSSRDAGGGEIILRRLEEDLQALRDDHGLCPDLIFITGDLAFGQIPEKALSEQLYEGWAWLVKVRKLYEPAVAANAIFLVPGNHDVDRQRVKRKDQEWLQSIGSSSAKDRIRQLIHEGGPEWRDYMGRLECFEKFIAEYCPHISDDGGRCIYSTVREIAGLRIGIAGLNSAWSSGNDDEKGRLWLGEWQLEQLTAQLIDADIRIALVHHPLNWLVESEDSELMMRLQEEYHIFLHGHEHQLWVQTPRDDHLHIAAGAVLDLPDTTLGYNIVCFDLEEKKGDIWLRTFDSRVNRWKGDDIPGRSDERGVWKVPLPWINSKTTFNEGRTIRDNELRLSHRVHSPPEPSELSSTGVPQESFTQSALHRSLDEVAGGESSNGIKRFLRRSIIRWDLLIAIIAGAIIGALLMAGLQDTSVFRCRFPSISADIASPETDSRPELVRIPAGEFEMGSDINPDEKKHRVSISRAFLISTTEITQAQYYQVTGNNPVANRTLLSDSAARCSDRGVKPNHPVFCVSWVEAATYCNLLSSDEGRQPAYLIQGEKGAEEVRWLDGNAGYRLPTEAEWEYAARGGLEGDRKYWFGDSESCLKQVAWFGGMLSPSWGSTHPVGQKRANPWGLFDVHGNVWEWVWDYKADYPPIASDPRGPDSTPDKPVRVWRGGGWRNSVDECRLAYRLGENPYRRYADLGFRIARWEDSSN